MVHPIEIHNTLVNLGLRKRGLCYQCAEDLYVKLRALNLQTLQLHWGVAHRFDLWLEHSGVIVTARGHPFEEGLVVDGWRHAGKLRWAQVARDRYPWVMMFKRKFPELQEQAERDAELAAYREKAEPRAEPSGEQGAEPSATSQSDSLRDVSPPGPRPTTPHPTAERPASHRVDSRAAAVRAPAVGAVPAGAAATSRDRGSASAIVTSPPNPQ
jgi:hypothetical protein